MCFIARLKYRSRSLILTITIIFLISCLTLKQLLETKETELYNDVVILPAKIIDKRIGLSPKLVAKLEQKKDLLIYQSSCHFHIWHDICSRNVEKFLTYPIFPHLPSVKDKQTKLQFSSLKKNSGFRVYGFIVVPRNREYRFKIYSNHISILFWFSKTNLPSNLNLLANSTFSEHATVDYSNKTVLLNANNKYFFDIVMKTDNLEGEFSLSIADTDTKNYEIIDEKYLKSYNSDVMEIDKQYTSYGKNLKLLHNVKSRTELLGSNENLRRSEIFNIPLMPNEMTKDILQTCEYRPSYIVKRKLKYKQGVWETRYLAIYPDDNTDMNYHHPTFDYNQISHGNDVIEKNVVEKLVEDVMKMINLKHNRVFKLSSIINIARTRDTLKGDRYLIELELVNLKTIEFSLFSQYVYQPRSGGKLCYPEGFQTNREAHVNVIVTVKNQGRWIRHLINTFSEIYKHTKDDKYTLIVVDFNSKDIDLKKALKESVIPNYILLNHNGKFYKTFGIQEAASKVQDPNQIVLQVDLHLIIPLDFLQVVRKHTVQGKTGFCPSVFRLFCGATPQHPNGFWESSGYGIFSVYKSDWDIFGGMNVKDFYNSWGGEDWDMLDRFLSAGYEVERLKMKNFYHVYHTKVGMWQF